MATQLPILYRDEAMVAVYKPADMLVHRSFRSPGETEFVLQTVRNQLCQHVFPVHRLDRPTAGVMVLAFNSEVARRLTEQFTAGEVSKHYLAVTRGHVGEAGYIDHPLTVEDDDYDDPRTSKNKEPQEAKTSYSPLAQVTLPIPVGRYPEARYSLVHLQPHTGRQHQLRRHMKHIFHPIVGDTTHGEGRHNRLFRDHFNWHRLALFAIGMRLSHPLTGIPLSLTTLPDEDAMTLFSKLGWNFPALMPIN
ncbi:tRNA pseudouridine(65) synthase TruC [Pokkaliibacter plantistimulans]|uniref:tRNA pseudouridine synthase C n=1 Tax=Proteobacteria bacterium 228 TaxID=2083153 RepID=A0A2S5KSW3_9PROT|nr:pseudouridine synthase [Pokkaliibacter plantistimulans]PPC77356.1 tRNA pseudouridine(65) synthase TruC [Pokkaliibacter plantistimulans]